VTDSTGLWTRWWTTTAKRWAQALSTLGASGLSASRAIVRPGLIVALQILLSVLLTQSRLLASGVAEDVTYSGPMTLNWTIDTYSCPATGPCFNEQVETSSVSGNEIVPLSAAYSSCSSNSIGTGPTIAPVGVGAPDIAFITPSGTDTSYTCGSLFYPGPGAFWYDGTITTPDGSFPTYIDNGGGEGYPEGQFDILSWDPTDTYPTHLTFSNATGSIVYCGSTANCAVEGVPYTIDSWSFSGQLIENNTITVNNTTDPASRSGNGFCTLREAIDNANTPGADTSGGDCAVGTGSDTIVFSVSGTITLSSTLGSLPAIANSSPESLTIDGTGRTITVDGANFNGVFVVNSGATLNLNRLTIAHGNQSAGEYGGGINNLGTLTVTNSTVSNNSADNGGGIANFGTLTVTNSTVSSNSAAALYGGGIDNQFGTLLTVVNSTFSGNSAASEGGGIFNGSMLMVSNSTFSSNSANEGGGIENDGGTPTVTNSILAKSTSGGNCAGTGTPPVTNGGYNISDDGTCGFGSSTAVNGDTIGDSVSDSNVALIPSGLANNGGPTATLALEPGSYAIAAIPTADCPATDQRGAPRPAPGHSACDVGAFEYGGVVPSPTPAQTTSMSVAASLAFGDVAVGQKVTKDVTIYNTGKTNSLVISSATLSDPEYALSGTGTCLAIPVTVATETSCTLGISFTPDVLGAHPATLRINDDATTSPQHVTLSGTGIAGLTTTKSSLVFGDVKFGAKGIEAFSVVNHQTQQVSLSESFNGTNATDFSVTGGTCTATLGADKACSIIVTFTPGALGTESAALSVADSPDPLSSSYPPIALSTGPTIPATVTPVTLAYGTLTAKTSPKTRDVTVTNLSGFPLSVSESFSGTNASDFAVTGGTCDGTAPADSSCTIAVTFTPTDGPTPESASMAVSVGNDPSSPYGISLTGTGP